MSKPSSLPQKGRPPVDAFTKNSMAAYTDRNAKYLVQLNAWKSVAFMVLTICLILAAGVIWETRQSRIQPYVVAVDKLGESLAIGPASKASPVDPRILRYEVARFVVQAREVIGDPVIEKETIADLYSHTTQYSSSFLNKYFRAHDPMRIGSVKTIQVSVDTVLAQSSDTYRVRWHEDVWGTDGKFIGRTWWSGFFTVLVKTPSDEDTIKKNPLGVYIDQINWTLIQG